MAESLASAVFDMYLRPSPSKAYWRQYSRVKLSAALGWDKLQRIVADSHKTVQASGLITGTDGAVQTDTVKD